MRKLKLSDGAEIPVLGLGTWYMGEDAAVRAGEIRALREGLDLGMSLIDTAEMYADGGAEVVVGEAIDGRRDDVYLVSKVYPHNASSNGVVAACERSLKRLKTDRLDLYLLHWRGAVPLAETVDAFERLIRDGKIGAWGVSNLDTGDMGELRRVAAGKNCRVNQVLYHLGERGIEWDLLPDCQNRDIAVMAYSPLGQAGILDDEALGEVAQRHGATPAAIALAFVLRQDGVVAIPKTSNVAHLRENAAALNVALTPDDIAVLDAAFPPPRRARPLAMI